MVIFIGDCNGTGLPMAVKRTENWTEETFGEGIWHVFVVVTFLGPSCNFCHVVLSRELNEIVPKAKPEEQAWIEKVPIGKCDRYYFIYFLLFIVLVFLAKLPLQRKWTEVQSMYGFVILYVIFRFLIMFLMNSSKRFVESNCLWKALPN